MSKTKMKIPIRIHFAIIFIGIMVGTILLSWVMNTLFLPKYYINVKTKEIFSAYETIKNVTDSDGYGSKELVDKLDDVCNKNNITIYIMDANSQTRYMSVNGGSRLEEELIGYIFGHAKGKVNILETGENYVLQRTFFDSGEYLEMYGRLSTGISFIMQIPIESIEQSALIANRFLTFVECFAALVGILIIWYAAGRITKPIKTITEISDRMVNLDFEVKYSGKHSNEIDVLGENINKLSESLEESISELKTANNELKKDIEIKEQSERMRKEFLSNVSHELKTPIALIQGYAEGLKEGVNDDPENIAFYCDVIMDEANKMNSLVKQLMTLNQLESGMDVVNIERFDIVSMIKNYLIAANILASSNNISVRMPEYNSIYVWGDEFKIEEVFTNYYSNAVNHCANEKIIDIQIMPRENGCVRVTVFNTGEKIPEDSITLVWDKFYKVDKARSREYGGSGVGLSIVKAIMESHNQKYGVENYENGVVFWFELEMA